MPLETMGCWRVEFAFCGVAAAAPAPPGSRWVVPGAPGFAARWGGARVGRPPEGRGRQCPAPFPGASGRRDAGEAGSQPPEWAGAVALWRWRGVAWGLRKVSASATGAGEMRPGGFGRGRLHRRGRPQARERERPSDGGGVSAGFFLSYFGGAGHRRSGWDGGSWKEVSEPSVCGVSRCAERGCCGGGVLARARVPKEGWEWRCFGKIGCGANRRRGGRCGGASLAWGWKRRWCCVTCCGVGRVSFARRPARNADVAGFANLPSFFVLIMLYTSTVHQLL